MTVTRLLRRSWAGRLRMSRGVIFACVDFDRVGAGSASGRMPPRSLVTGRLLFRSCQRDPSGTECRAEEVIRTSGYRWPLTDRVATTTFYSLLRLARSLMIQIPTET